PAIPVAQLHAGASARASRREWGRRLWPWPPARALTGKAQSALPRSGPIPSDADEGYSTIMSRNHVARLTEGQRDVLRMFNRQMETREIARERGISPDGVNQRIKAAMRTLGVNKRRDAALLLAEVE